MKNKSTYALLINADSEDKGRSMFEASIYAVVVFCMAFSAYHFASTAVTLPGKSRVQNAAESMIAKTAVAQSVPAVRG